jgi:geranylgeranyl diphosphate synthase type I
VADCAALIETLGARAAVEERIDSLMQQGLHELDAAPIDPVARLGLRQLAANLCTPSERGNDDSALPARITERA